MTKPPKDGFGWLAPIYDLLANLVFGSAIRTSQIHFLSFIPTNANVLIVGGGTGWIIPEIFKAQPRCTICFVDASRGMVEKARKNYSDADDRVRFILGTVLEIHEEKFDVIILPFFLDMFSSRTIHRNISAISECGNPSAIWLVTDFVDNQTRWGSALLFVMYRFFRLICAIDAEKIPDWHQALLHSHLQFGKSKSFYGSLIATRFFISKV